MNGRCMCDMGSGRVYTDVMRGLGGCFMEEPGYVEIARGLDFSVEELGVLG